MPQEAIPNAGKDTVPLWVGKHRFSILTDRCSRTIDNWMASGRLRYRKFPSGMVRIRAGDAEEPIGIGGLKQENVHHFSVVTDRITATDLAGIYSVSVDTVREWVAQGIVPHFTSPAGTTKFDPAAVEEALTRFDVDFTQNEHFGEPEREPYESL